MVLGVDLQNRPQQFALPGPQRVAEGGQPNHVDGVGPVVPDAGESFAEWGSEAGGWPCSRQRVSSITLMA